MRQTLLLAAALALALTACAPADPESSPAPSSTAAVDPAVGTDPGTALAYGDEATVVWQPESDVAGVLDVSVDAVAEQDESVFDGWVSEVVPDARPYFVTVSLANAGESDLGGQEVPIYLRDDTGALGAPWTLGGDFADCQSGPLPTPFAAGARADMCLVYLVPDGARVRDLVFEPTEGYDPITWTGTVTRPDREAKPGKRAKSGRRG